MLIGVAGPVANFVLAFVLMFFYFGWINEVPRHEVKTTTIEWIVAGSPAAQAGLQPGDLITHFDVVDNPGWDQVNERAAINQGQTVPVTVDRAGQTIALSLHQPSETRGRDFDLTDLGMIPSLSPAPSACSTYSPACRPRRRGCWMETPFRPSMAMPSIPSVAAFLHADWRGQAHRAYRRAQRRGSAAHRRPPSQPEQAGNSALPPPPFPLRQPAAFKGGDRKSEEFCAENSSLIIEVLGRLFTHKVSMSQLSGPVGIARMAGDAAESKGWLPKLGLASAISLNLGILNLMPFPILDGGLILLLIIESVIRRDIGMNIKERIYQAAFVVLIAFFAFVIFNDVTKLPMFTHFKP